MNSVPQLKSPRAAVIRTLHILLFVLPGSLGPLPAAEEGYWLDPRFQVLEADPGKPFVILDDRRLLSLSGGRVRISRDNGKNWEESWQILTDNSEGPGAAGLAVRTTAGVIVAVGTDSRNANWKWDSELGEAIDPRRDVWTMRSLDNGRTWVDHQQILEGYCGALIDMIATRDGRIVIPVQFYVSDPGRNATRAFLSSDQGKTWQKGNILDLGGAGHHDGAFEATLTELSDGSLWMLIRTSLERFWNAYSEDGRYWRVLQPSNIESSNSPGFVQRLESGRIVMIWNPAYDPDEPFGATPDPARSYASQPKRAGAYSEVAASWFREAIQIAFSEDDGKTWTRPLTFARFKGSQVAYPYLVEREPGVMWMRIGAFVPWLSVRESDLVK